MIPIELPVAELKSALIGFGKIIRKPTLPILNMLLIERDREGWVRITATDLSEYATLRLETPQREEPASVVVPYPELLKLTKRCGSHETIGVVTTGTPEIILSYPLGTQTASVALPYLRPDEFPPLQKVEGNPERLDPKAQEAMLQAMQCVSSDDTRYVINGVCLDVSQNSHYVVATDGRQLYSSNSFKLPVQDSVIVRDNRFINWKSFADDGEWHVLLQEADKDLPRFIRFNSRRWTLITRLIDGTFPNWRQILLDEDNFNAKAVLTDDGLKMGIETVSRIPCEDIEHKPINLVLAGRKLIVRGGSSERPVESELIGTSVSGEPITIRVNRDYLVRAWKMGLNTVHLIDSTTPIRFSRGGRQLIVMPLKLDTKTAPTSTSAVEQEAPVESTVPDSSETADQPEENNAEQPEQAGSPEELASAQSEPSDSAEALPALDQAMQFVEGLKTTFQDGLAAVKELSGQLKQVQREQKTSSREMQTFRSRLRDLQAIKI